MTLDHQQRSASNTIDPLDDPTCPVCGRTDDVIWCKICRVTLRWDHRTEWEEAKASGERWLQYHVRTQHTREGRRSP